ncbi:glycoside hydrolase, family 16 [Frankia casuarinae]|uniref:Glycoside hydrolase, family 16 n=2 Tax=Frankiaceae TaxID=74712 RepID=Q2J699_FRACC|nr:glycoside hydrolase, family 16 [Frankia casuarinae]
MKPRVRRWRLSRRGGLVALLLVCLVVGCGTSKRESGSPQATPRPSVAGPGVGGMVTSSALPSGPPSATGASAGSSPRSSGEVSPPNGPRTPREDDGMEPRLLWSDEFDGPANASVDPARWLITQGGKWGPTDVSCYTADPRNVGLDGKGHLKLTAIAEKSPVKTCGDTHFSSGRVETRGKASWRYGYFEFRARLPIGTGTLPALWLLGPNGIYDWPRSGEIDVVEATANEPATVHTNIVGVDGSGNRWEAGWWGRGKNYVYPGGTLADRYHNYALDWGPNRLDFYFDGLLIRHLEPKDTPVWLWNKDFYIIMDVAVSAKLSPPLPPASAFPQTLFVDYVRVYSGRP